MQGLLQRLACDGPDSPWLLTGTSRGHLTLWDMRFQIPLTQWAHPLGQPVEALAPAVAPVGHLGRGGVAGGHPPWSTLQQEGTKLVSGMLRKVNATRYAAGFCSFLPVS